MADLNFTAVTPTGNTKLVGFDSAVPGGERTYRAGQLPVSVAQAAAIEAVQDSVDAHEAATDVHGATPSNTANRIAMRDADGVIGVGGIRFSTTGAPSVPQAGDAWWNDVDKTLNLMSVDGTILQIGHENVLYARNVSGVAEPNGAAIRITGSSGQRTTLGLAQADSFANCNSMIGLVTSEDGIDNNAFGVAAVFGLVRDLDTSAIAEGTEIYLSPTVAGGWTATRPTTEGHFVVRIGWIIRQHATQGMIFLSPHYHGSVTGDAVMNATSKAAARAAIDLGNADNTGDANKPVSTATQTALDAKLDDSQLDTDGTLTANSDTKIASQKATKTYADTKVAAARAVNTSGLATGGGNLSADRTITVPKSTPAQVIAGTDDATAVTPLGNKAALDAKVDPIANGRAAGQALVFDGTAGATFAQAVELTGSWSLRIKATFADSGTTRILLGGASGALSVYRSNTNSLQVGVQAGSDYAVHAPVVGVLYHYTITYDGTTLKTYVGETLVNSQVASISPSVAIPSFGANGFGNYMLGRLGDFLPYNYALSADQVAALFRDGAPAAEDRGGSQVSTITGTDSDFSGANNWVSDTITGGDATVNTTGGKLVVTAISGTDGGVRLSNSLSLFVAGRTGWVRIEFTLDGVAGGNVVLGRRAGGNTFAGFADCRVESGGATVGGGNVLLCGNGTHRILVKLLPSQLGGQNAFGFGNGSISAVTAFNLSAVTSNAAGTLAQYDPNWDGLGGYWPDTNGEGRHLALPASGVQPLIKSGRGESYPSTFAHGAPILTVTVPAGTALTAGDTVAELVVANACWGMWLVSSGAAGIYYIGGHFADGANNLYTTITEIGVAGSTSGAYGLCAVLESEVVDPSRTRLKLVASGTYTTGSTQNISLFHLSGGLNRAAVK